jgi:methionine synthase I (cobalamin-dependent)
MEMMKCVRMIHGLCIESNNPFLPIFVGGCCRTTPSTIKALRAAVDEYIDNF